MLKASADSGERVTARTARKTGSSSKLELDTPPTLSDLGLDKKTSHIAQKLAELPQEQFEAVIAETKERRNA
jgi:hypothetical protein